MILGIDETLMLKGSLMLYGVPLLLMFLGMAIANSFVTHMIEFYTLMGAVLGLSLGVMMIKRAINEKMQMFYNEAQLIRFK